MNTILLQKILDILTEGLAHVGDFFKDLFISDPQDGQVIGYDADAGKWKNIDLADLSIELTHTSGPDDEITITDAAADMPLKALIVDIKPIQASGTPTPDNPLPISGTDSIVITHTYGDNETETKTINLPSTVYFGSFDVASGKGTKTYIFADFGSLTWAYSVSNACFYTVNVRGYKNGTPFMSDSYKDKGVIALANLNNYEGTLRDAALYLKNTDYTDPDLFKTAMTGHYVIYEIETPEVISTTPTEIKTQGGTENFAIDANEMELEYYTDTAGTIKDLVCITEDITSEITKNTTDFSDILLKVSRNNKVVSIEIYNATTAAAVNETFLSNLPKPAMNCKVLLVNTTLGEDGTILGTLKTTGELEIATSGAKSFSGLITYVAK